MNPLCLERAIGELSCSPQGALGVFCSGMSELHHLKDTKWIKFTDRVMILLSSLEGKEGFHLFRADRIDGAGVWHFLALSLHALSQRLARAKRVRLPTGPKKTVVEPSLLLFSFACPRGGPPFSFGYIVGIFDFPQ